MNAEAEIYSSSRTTPDGLVKGSDDAGKSALPGYGNHIGVLNDMDSVESDGDSPRNIDTHRGILDKENQQYFNQDQQFENDSNKSDIFDEQTMNVFGFNDDLNLDDRQIVINPAENEIYKLVERPKYLLSFELKD